MRKWLLLAVFAASFALYGNGAIACANSGHVNQQETVATAAAQAEFFFEIASPSTDHRAHHGHRNHDKRTCDGICCCHAASAGAALLASPAIEYPAVRSAAPSGQLPEFRSPQFADDFYGPPKSFA